MVCHGLCFVEDILAVGKTQEEYNALLQKGAQENSTEWCKVC